MNTLMIRVRQQKQTLCSLQLIWQLAKVYQMYSRINSHSSGGALGWTQGDKSLTLLEGSTCTQCTYCNQLYWGVGRIKDGQMEDI